MKTFPTHIQKNNEIYVYSKLGFEKLNFAYYIMEPNLLSLEKKILCNNIAKLQFFITIFTELTKAYIKNI